MLLLMMLLMMTLVLVCRLSVDSGGTVMRSDAVLSHADHGHDDHGLWYLSNDDD